MGDGWYAMCDSLEAYIECYQEDIDDWSPGSTSAPTVPTKTCLMNVAGISYWSYRENRDKDNSDQDSHGDRIYKQELPLPPCVHNNMTENIDLILVDLRQMYIDKVEHDISNN